MDAGPLRNQSESSGSSGFAPAYSPSPLSSFAWCSSKLSEMHLRKMRPRTTCLYSAASMLLRNLSAASQSLASKPMLAELLKVVLLDFARAIFGGRKLRNFFPVSRGKEQEHSEDPPPSCSSRTLARRAVGKDHKSKDRSRNDQNRKA